MSHISECTSSCISLKQKKHFTDADSKTPGHLANGIKVNILVDPGALECLCQNPSILTTVIYINREKLPPKLPVFRWGMINIVAYCL